MGIKPGIFIMDKFTVEKKVFYHHTDAGAVVYYANYLKFLEEARTEFCLSRGIDLKALAENGIWFVVSRVEINYKAPARYLDTINISTSVEKISWSFVQFQQQIRKGDKLLLEAKLIWVCVNREFKPRSIPDIIHNLS